MAQASSELLSASDITPLLCDLYGRTGSALGMGCFMHYEPAEVEGHLKLRVHGGIPAQMRTALSPVAHAGVVCGDVYRTAAPVVLAAHEIESDKRMWWARMLGLRSYACHPLLVGGSVAGTLAFASDAAKMAPELVALLFALSAQVAMAIGHRQMEETAAAQARKRQHEFLSVLAHELRNPMAPIRSGIDIARADAASPEAKARAFSMMDRQLTRMTRLVDDLLDAARIESGTVRMRMAPLVLRDVMDAAVESVEPALQAKHQMLSLTGDALDEVVVADPVRLSQALSNVLNNSAKFAPGGTPIDVDASVDADRIRVRVRDHGAPIPDSDLPGIFKLFAQANRRGAGDGMGVGLALVRTLVELHGGSVEAKNRSDGLGAEFVVVLPRSQAGTASSTAAPSVESAKATPGLRVLVVDDNEDAADALCMLLELEGNTLRIARDGLAAVAEAADFRPDYIFMDIGLPEINGLEATRRIRALQLEPKPYICALTGLGNDTDREAAAAAGCDWHFTKPIDIDAALALLEERR